MEPWQEGCIAMRILQSFCMGRDLLPEKGAFQTCALVWQCTLWGIARGHTQPRAQLHTRSYIKDCSCIQLSLLLLQPTFHSLTTTISSVNSIISSCYWYSGSSNEPFPFYSYLDPSIGITFLPSSSNFPNYMTNPSDLSSEGPTWFKRFKEFGRARRSITRVSRLVVVSKATKYCNCSY